MPIVMKEAHRLQIWSGSRMCQTSVLSRVLIPHALSVTLQAGNNRI